MSIHRRLMTQRYGLEHSTFLYSPVVFDPIFTPIFTAIIGSGGFTIGATTISYASIASAIATTALSIGIQAMMAPKPPKPEDGKVPKTQAIPYRNWAVGRVRMGGAYMLWEAKGRNLMSVQAITGHRISAVQGFWLHDDRVDLGDLDVNGFTTYDEGDRYGNNVQIQTRLGLPTETAYEPIVDLLDAEDIWTDDHRGDGQASMAMLVKSVDPQNQAKRFPYGAPALSVEIDGALCWDFRDPLQDPEDPETWEWTRNAALIMCWHQCFNEFGHKRDYTRAILPVLDMWKEEADVCDEDVDLAGGGTEKRYECNGWDSAENGPKAGTNAILSACDGWICERGDGALLFTVGKFRESRCGALTDADIVGHQIQHDVLPEDEVNRLVPRFTYPDTGYTTSDTDYFEDIAAQVSAGRVLAEEADYSFCHQWRQARRLGKRDWLRIQQKKRGTLDIRLSGINAIYSRWVRLTTPNRIPSLNGAVVENRRSVLSLTRGGFQMEIIKHPENIDDWNPDTDEGEQPPVPPAPNAEDIVTPVINLVQAKPNGSTVYIRVVIIDPEDDSLTPVVRYRLTDTDGAGTDGAWVEQVFHDAEPGVPVAGFIELATNVVPSDKAIEVQVAFRTPQGDGDWSISSNVTSTVDTVAPLSLTAFTEVAGTHYGVAPFSFTTKNDLHLARVAIYRTAVGVAINPSTDLVETIGVSPGTTFTYTVGDAPTAFSTNGDFALAGPPPTLGSNWTISAGHADHSAGTGGSISWAVSLTAGDVVRWGGTINSISGASATLTDRLTGGTTVTGTAFTTSGLKSGHLTALTGNTLFGFLASTNAVVQVDNITAFKQTADQEPFGSWDYHAIPLNASGVAGPTSGPVTVTVV